METMILIVTFANVLFQLRHNHVSLARLEKILVKIKIVFCALGHNLVNLEDFKIK
jgi:hypothetical protein